MVATFHFVLRTGKRGGGGNFLPLSNFGPFSTTGCDKIALDVCPSTCRQKAQNALLTVELSDFSIFEVERMGVGWQIRK